LPDNLPQPLALRYHGHQFRMYNPQIGDAAAFCMRSFATATTVCSIWARRDPGQTPYSRFGDGRLTLKGAGAGDFGDRDAGSARRPHQQDLLGDRDR
jgi:uncharacterized protein YdiU (UPF0061 family)